MIPRIVTVNNLDELRQRYENPILLCRCTEIWIPKQRLLVVLFDEDNREYSCHRYFIGTNDYGAKEWQIAIDGHTPDLEKVWKWLSNPGPFTEHAIRQQSECIIRDAGYGV